MCKDEDYEGIVAVEYIDTGTDSGEKSAEENEIKIAPSQIFIDSNGVKFSRHDGYLPQEEHLLFFKKIGINK
ncbi:MAG: hypothetical protein PQJ61_04380 [Spirochaetales bacterium]|uniref:Thioredoxin-like fold domain-containing protein n=1 Tax=Candidatus Thalassospirochaeta sargassi TaxID=3119039 RepID=A0AAJ1IDU7_9SPIO|nr:hypothetical protein [Spirochaetales bacterium]